jgi:hypothetical protein
LLTTTTSADGSEVSLVLPDFGMYHVSGDTAKNEAELKANVTEMEYGDRAEMVYDVKDGYVENRPTHKYSHYLLGMVIGENPDATMPEYDTKDWELSKEQKRVVRWSKPAEAPQFGDVVMFCQSNAIDWNTFWQLPCDTTPSCEFLLSSLDGQRWTTVSRQSGDITSVDLDSVVCVVRPFGQVATTQMH